MQILDAEPHVERDTDIQVREAPKVSVRTEGHSEAYVWYVVYLLFLVNAFNYMDRTALSVLLPFIKEDLQLSDGQLGLLVGFAFSLFYAVCGLPIARWADRGIRRDIIAVTLSVWSVMTALSGAAQNFWQLFAARVGVGVGEAGCHPPAQSIICDYVPLARRPGVFAVHSLGGIVGLMLGMAFAGWLAEIIGWRWTFVALGMPGIALALIVKMTLVEPTRGRQDSSDSGEVLSTADTIRALWRCPTYQLLTTFLVVNGFVQFGVTQWWPSFYVRVHGLEASAVGVLLGASLGLGSGAGVLLGGSLANRLSLRDIKLPLIMCAGATTLVVPAALGSLFVPHAPSSIALAALSGFLWAIPAGPVIAAVYSVTRPAMRAMAGAVTIFFTSAVGFGFGAFFVGLISDTLTPSLGSQSLRYALAAVVMLFPLTTFVLIRAAKQLSNDLRLVDDYPNTVANPANMKDH